MNKEKRKIFLYWDYYSYRMSFDVRLKILCKINERNNHCGNYLLVPPPI